MSYRCGVCHTIVNGNSSIFGARKQSQKQRALTATINDHEKLLCSRCAKQDYVKTTPILSTHADETLDQIDDPNARRPIIEKKLKIKEHKQWVGGGITHV